MTRMGTGTRADDSETAMCQWRLPVRARDFKLRPCAQPQLKGKVDSEARIMIMMLARASRAHALAAESEASPSLPWAQTRSSESARRPA
jgi:hypothetical protein